MLKRLNIILILLFAFSFSGALLADEAANKYFPSTLGSFWVYEDQDGNEFTRHAIEGEEIAGKTFSAFSYEPEVEDWAEYSPFIRPFLYNVSEAGITLVAGDEIKKTIKSRLSKEIDTLKEIMKRDENADDAQFTYDIKVEAHELSYLLPTSVNLNEEWDVNEIKASLALDLQGGDEVKVKIDYTITETGIALDTETVKTAAGTFEDCLKVEYRTETTAVFTPPVPPDEADSPGETVTTVWFAPNVGIVKFHQIRKYIFLEMVPEDADLPMPADPKHKTLELKRYAIKTADLKSVEKKSITTPKPLKDDAEKEKTKTSNAQSPNYFPGTLGSFWVYEDQDGNELTRKAIEGEEIAGETLSAFSYEPIIENWTDYHRYIHPSLYQSSEKGVSFAIGNQIEKAIKARLSKEVDTVITKHKEEDSSFELDYNAEVEAQDKFLFLPVITTKQEEWEAGNINAKITTEFGEANFNFIETGQILGTETVKTSVGTFKDCLKVEYRTETILKISPPDEDIGSPGESITTLWLAPNVGVVKVHQKVEDMLLKAMLDLKLPSAATVRTLELKKYEIKSADTESSKNNSNAAVKSVEDKVETQKAKPSSDGAQGSNYFPGTLDSFWVYEDQVGNELTRRAVEGEEIAGETYHAFSYEPELKDWTEYSPFIRPPLFNRSDDGIKLIVKNEVEKAVKARLKKEVGILTDAIKRGAPPDAGIDVDIKVRGQNQLFLLSDTITFNEEWDVNQIEANVKMTFLNGGIPEGEQLVIDFTILETAIISSTETVETPAGKFEDCLKVEYRTKTTAAMTPVQPPDEVELPGETVTTVWYAPNVGIVKFHQKLEYIFLEMLPEGEGFPMPPDPKPKTLELKKYEIKSAKPENEESN